jgi:hypothetical protein
LSLAKFNEELFPVVHCIFSFKEKRKRMPLPSGLWL